MTTAANRVIKNTGILYARMGITVFISLYATRLILSALGINDFGIFNVVGGVVSMLTFLNIAMAGATQRFMSYAEGAGDFQRLKAIFNVSVVLHIIIAVLVFILFQVAGYFLFNGILKIPEARITASKLIFQFAIISTLFSIISVPYDAVINTHENMFLFAILGIAEAFLKLAIAFYITYTNFDHLITYGLLMAALSIVLLIFRWFYCNRKYIECKIDFKRYCSKPIFKEMTGFAAWSFLGASSSMVASYGQGIIINIFFGTIVNAAQAVAGQVSGQLGAFAVTMLKALNPIIDKSEGAGNRSLMLKASITGSKISFFLLIFFYVPIWLDMPYIFNIWLKNVPQYAILFCRLLLIRNLIDQLFITLSTSISAVGNIRSYQIYSSLLYIFPLIVSYILFLLHFPAYSLYLVFMFNSLLTSFIIVYFAKKNCNLSIPVFLKDVVVRCVVSFFIILAISAIPLAIMPVGLVRFLTISIISALSFVISVWYVGFTSDEKNQFGDYTKSFFKNIYSKKKILF